MIETNSDANGSSTVARATAATGRLPAGWSVGGELTLGELMHAARRQGLLAVLIGGCCAVVAAGLTWLLQPPVHEAEALLQLSATGNQLVFDEVEPSGDFEIFQGTQKELLKSRFVMTAALRQPGVATTKTIRGQQKPVDWLIKNVKVSTPESTELMRVAVPAHDAAEAVLLVNAVVQAYQDEVVNFQQNLRRKRLDEVDQVFIQKEGELRRKRGELKRLAEQLGSSDREALAAKQQILLQELGDLRRQLVDVQTQMWTAQSQMRTEKVLIESLEREGASPLAVENALVKDEIYKQLLSDKTHVLRLQSEVKAAFKKDSPVTYAKLREAVDRHLGQRRQEVKAEVEAFEPLQAHARLSLLESTIAGHRELEKRIAAEVDRLKTEIEKVGNRSIDVEMMRGEIDHLNQVLHSVAMEKEQLRVELRSRPRVEVLRAADEAVLANKTIRLAITGLVTALVFCSMVVGLLLQDIRLRKINTSSDVSRATDLEVIGSMALIPNQTIRRTSERLGRKRDWQAILSESVNRITTRILVEANTHDARMILVTSALAGEGKTTLATQLSLSLARTGHSVIVADLDLRRPMMHQVLSASQAPGFCELLRDEAALSDVIQATDLKELSAVPAGYVDEAALRGLSREATGALLRELRGMAEFVIIDACPVLPLADIGYICSHVDAVVFSVRRDVSRLHRVRDAHEFVRKSGANVLGAVVVESIGAHAHDRRYLPEDPARPSAFAGSAKQA